MKAKERKEAKKIREVARKAVPCFFSKTKKKMWGGKDNDPINKRTWLVLSKRMKGSRVVKAKPAVQQS